MNLWPLCLTLCALLPAAGCAAQSAPKVRPLPAGWADADIWVCAGQSNMAGAGIIAGQPKPEPGVVMYNMDGRWMPAVEPLHRIFASDASAIRDTLIKNWGRPGYDAARKQEAKQPYGGVGPGMPFARHIVRQTGRKVALVPCALGATSMADWSPRRKGEGDGSLYGNMLQRIAEVGGKVKGLIWYQGEGETMAGLQAPFTVTWLEFVDSIRRDTGIADLPIITVQIARYCLDTDPAYGLAWESIRDQQRTVVARRVNLFVVPAIDLPTDDLIHIGTTGHKRLGVRMAEVALDKVYHRPGRASTIDYASYEIVPDPNPLHNRLKVRFTGVNGRLQAEGRASGFSLRSDEPLKDGPMVFKVEFDAKEPSTAILWTTKAIEKPVSLYYGAGLDPYANIADSRDMAVPAFGPIRVLPVAK
jgi:sialate O-acetylesterase